MVEFNANRLNYAEENNDPSIIGSVAAGIATGLIRIPQGAASLFASIYDITNDTDTAQGVEEWFDKNIYSNLGDIDEKAEATTAGKITAALVNIGIPGGIAFRQGTKLATHAIKNAKAGKYFTLNNKALAGQAQKALALNRKGKVAKFGAGAVTGGVAEGVFVGDVEDFGSIGDLLGGPTDLDNESRAGGRDEATREVLNRIKFGTEGALLTGVIGGIGNLIKRVATRGKKLKYSNSLTDRILNKFSSGFRPRGDNPEQFFLTAGEQKGKRAADLNRAVQLSRAVDKDVDRMFPAMKRMLDKSTREEKYKMLGDLEDVMFSGTPAIDAAGRATMGVMDEGMMKNIGAKMLNKGGKPEHIDNIFTNIGLMRNKWEDMATLVHSKLPVASQPIFKNIMGSQFKQWIGRTYGIFENKSAIPFLNYKPTEEIFERVVNIFMRQNRMAISRANATPGSVVPNPISYEQASTMVSNILRNVKQETSLLKMVKESKDTRALRTPYFDIDANFVKDSVADDLVTNGIFQKRLEQSVRAGKYAAKETETGIPKATVIGQGSKAFRELFGEVRDVRQKMLHGTERLSLITRKSEFLDKLVKDSAQRIKDGGRGYFYGTKLEAERALAGIPVEQYKPGKGPWGETASENPVMNAFNNNAWGDKDLINALQVTEKRLINDKVVSFLYDSLFLFPKATSQFAKTILSPITHARNFFSAATFQTANGIWFENPKVLAAAWRDAFGALQPQTFKANTPQAQEFYRKLLKYRVVNSNVKMGDMSGLFQDIAKGRGGLTSQTAKMMVPNTIRKWSSKAARWSQDMYVAEDDFWKGSNWIMERYRYKNAYKKAFDNGTIKKMPSNDSIEEMAANITRNTVPNYEYVPEFIRSLRRMPVGNFVSFPAEILRTGTGIVQQGIKEINDPVLRAIGMKRLAGFAATLAVVPPAIVEMFKTIYDFTEDEVAAIKRFLPSWSKNSTILPMRDDEGNLKYIDFSHGFAYDTLIRPVQTVLNAVAAGEKDEKTLMEGFMKGIATSTAELGQPFIAESIWTEAFLDVLRGGGKTKDGKILYTDQTPGGEKVSAIMNHLVRAQAPFSLQQMIRLGFAATGKPSRTIGPYTGSGQTYELTDEALGFTGYRPVPIDPARSLDFKMSGYQRAIRNARREFNAKLLRGDPVSPQDVIDRYIIANKAKWESMKDMSLDIGAGLILGVPGDDLMNVLGRISKKDAAALVTDKFIPFTISENIQEVFKENAEKLGISDPYKEAEQAIKSLQDVMSEIDLTDSEWPDLTEMFNMAPADVASTPPGALNTPAIDPKIYQRPTLTLGQGVNKAGMFGNFGTGTPQNTGLTANQLALLSPSEQQYYMRKNQTRV
jgi:hypothetical protein